MKSTFRILFYLKRDKLKLDGTAPVWCRVTVDGQATRFNTKSSILPDLWDSKANKAKGKTRDAINFNSLLDEIKASIYKVYYDLQLRENDVNAERIKNIFLGIEIKNHTLLELCQHHIDEMSKLIGISISKGTVQKYELSRSHLSTFIQQQYNLTDISLKDVNHMFLCDYEVCLITTFNCGPNTTAKFMQRLRTIILLAKGNGWIYSDPFVNYKIRFQKVDKGYLTQEQVEAIMQKQFSAKRLEQVRDIFVFCCFTGLAYIDVKNLKKTNIRTSFDGKLWIMSKRIKTGVSFNIPLLDIPKQILEKYTDSLPNDLVLPVLSNQKMNAYLKEIGDICGIEKELTFHLARHTFATLTLSKGASIESVSSMLGHTNIKTTQIYAKITDGKICNDMAVFAKKWNERAKKSQLDQLFESLTLYEKMFLFNLPANLPFDPFREKRLSELWNALSEEEKMVLWKKAFENDINPVLALRQDEQQLAVNQ